MAQTGKKSSGKKTTTTRRKSAPAKSGGRKPGNPSRPIRREVGAVVCLFLAIFSFIGYFNVDAWFIRVFCGFVKSLIGWGYYLFPPALLLCAAILGFHRGRPVALRVVSAMLLPLLLGSLCHLFSGGLAEKGLKFAAYLRRLYETGGLMASGGLIGGCLADGLRKLFSVYGAAPVLIIAFLLFVYIGTNIRLDGVVSYFKNRPHLEYETEPEPEPAPRPAHVAATAAAPAVQSEPVKPRRRSRHDIDVPLDDEPVTKDKEEETPGVVFNGRPRVKTPDQVLTEEPEPFAQAPKIEVMPRPKPDPQPEPESEPERIPYRPSGLPVNAPEPAKARSTGIRPEAAAAATGGLAFTPAETSAPVAAPVPAAANVPAAESAPAVSESVDLPAVQTQPKPEKIKAAEVAAETESIARAIEEESREEKPAYQFPPLDLLKAGAQTVADSRGEIAINRERLDTTIHSFGVNASISGITRGPTVTRYDLELEAGVKLSRLTNLSNDLALALGVSSVRIAPIPDKIATVGIEVPNKTVSTVMLRDILESREFENASSKLAFAIGKDIGGNAIVGNIAKLPHLLIAGTTGSGKSVCMNSLILSLIYKSTPEEVRLIMVDPKMVELGVYNGIPHLYIPVVTDPKKAAGALQWSVVEMMKRYKLFSEAGVRDLSGYNAYQKRVGGETIPQVVIVIDELADLMLVASKEVEESICRVAQMGRASGMHLVIATQRPSADVITGLMKANIPSRIAFAVSSAMESRIILDAQGAEKLIGQGDMLYAPLGSGKPLRVQGAFVSDEEREEVIRFVKSGSEAEYDESILQQIELAAESGGKNGKGGGKAQPEPEAPGGDYDELLPQAVEVILETKQASVSMLQRRLKLGYSRAARLVDQMEEMGIVGPFEGSKPRQLLITKEQWQEMQMASGGEVPQEIPGQFEPDDYSMISEAEDDPF
ncbi:MAG: DNA translocase FtsK [Oscillospiraceae bacterium]|nr:DNA translocase FtsK [Oscillospiraceae bacterium]